MGVEGGDGVGESNGGKSRTTVTDNKRKEITVLKGRCFADVEELKQKTEEVLKGIKIDEFKNYFEQWKKVSIGVFHQMKVIEF